MASHRKFLPVLALLLAAGMWYYVDAVLIPVQRAHRTAAGYGTGNQSDLYPRWLGTREFLLHGRDPYSAEMTRDIQAGFYGRPIDRTRPNDPRDESRFAYPLYVVFLLAATIAFPFRQVQLCFAVLMIVLTLASVPIYARGLGLHLDRTRMAVVGLLTLGTFPVVQAIHLQQLTLLVAGLIAISIAAILSGHLVTAGVLLAVCTIKPQLVLPLLAWFALWTASDLRRRRALAISFSVTLAALLGGSLALMPSWPVEWRSAVHAYMEYTSGSSLPEELFGKWMGVLVECAVVAATTFVCWRARRSTPGEAQYSLALVSTLTATLLVIPKWASYDQILLVPLALLVLPRWRDIPSRSPAARVCFWVSVAVLAWQWLAAVIVSIAAKVAGTANLGRWHLLPIATVLMVPFAAAAVLVLLAAQTRIRSTAPPTQRSAPALANRVHD